jgi:hypothetical protein
MRAVFEMRGEVGVGVGVGVGGIRVAVLERGAELGS